MKTNRNRRIERNVGRHGLSTRMAASGFSIAMALAFLTSAVLAADNWPLFRGDAACTGVVDGTLPEELTVAWKYAVPGGSFDATAVIADGAAFLGDFDGVVHAIDLASGELRWNSPTDSLIFAAGAVRDGSFYVGDADGRFHCIDTKTGEEKWRIETGAEINSSPNFHKDTVIIGSQDSVLYCIQATTGEINWKYQIPDQIQSTPAIVENRTFLLGCDGVLHIIDLDQGKPIGQIGIMDQTRVAPAVLGDRLFFGTYGEQVYGVNWKQDKVLWTYQNEQRHFRFDSSAAATNEVVVIGSDDKLVHALDPDNGKRIWMFPTRGRVVSSPVIVGPRVFVGSADGRLYALDLKTGTKQWEYDAGGSFIASPAVASERLVIANQDGTVYCFGKK